jgi:hypothetical protein
MNSPKFGYAHHFEETWGAYSTYIGCALGRRAYVPGTDGIVLSPMGQ